MVVVVIVIVIVIVIVMVIVVFPEGLAELVEADLETSFMKYKIL